jgi:steroid delta-isomerase-like uncharacterized protein
LTTETNIATVRRMIDQVYNARKLDLVDEFFTEDLVTHIVGVPPDSIPAKVGDGIKMSLDAYPDFNLQLDDVIAVGDQVAARWTMRGTQQGEFMGIPPSGHRVTQQGATFYRLVNTRIAEIWFYADSLDMMRQLGVAPVQG